ncbi:MAG: hypothetical protein WCF33_21530 [Pseudonocardiaceae bacterium]
MVDTAAKLLTIFMVAILTLLLLGSVGGYVAAGIPLVAGTIGDILHELLTAFQRIIQSGYRN